MPSPTTGPIVETTTDRLTLERIEVTQIVVPLAREFRGSHYRMTQRATVLVRLHTHEGIVGEAYAGDEYETLAEIAHVIRAELEPALASVNLVQREKAWAAMYPSTFDILRDRRIGLVAIAAVDAALWDAIGKMLGVPCYQLWGGYRDTIPLMAIGGYYGEPLGSIDEEMSYYRSIGLAGVKFKIGGASPAEDAARASLARESAGDDFIITVDANQGYSVADAIEFANKTGDLNLRWFEEPVGWANDRRDLATVRARTNIPIAAGQSELSPTGCRELMEAGSIDVCNFDASWSGGPTAWLRAAAVAHTFALQMGHHEEPHLSSHLLASQSNGTYAECFHPDRDPFWWNLIADERPLVDGCLSLPNKPGLGWTLDEDYIAANTVTS